ncbi:potassium-transporting ATPase subunit KdpC [Metabacillus sp. GX 13764]|uniref:potassium-transporting ATPase subunit KdpC n=1 Tax=Metabacillus kandeliae TaxID=2900151 RepID=UPI001E3EA506|nr:potassium-transporting ATPase subunit KdpC [Metabacillus kandeliae]MCD7035209.1 potassium-transporting ATPase subunit KdpC [Metabacillus kandeliae]
MLKNLRITIVLLLICGVAYPLLMTGLAQVIMPAKADGSILYGKDGRPVGSRLIGQTFTKPEYFSGRISSIGNDAASSGSKNYAPSNKEMIDRTKKDIAAFLKANPEVKKEDIPADLLTNSGSGLDPHISPLAAEIQVPRIAKLRHLDENTLNKLINKHTAGRQLGLFGDPRVNVLELNMDLDSLK